MSTQPLSTFTALTFDCYGTLIDWESGLLAVLRPWADRHDLAAPDDDLLGAFARAESAEELARPGALYTDILRAVHRRIAADFSINPTAEDADALARSVGEWPVFPDTADALRRLRSRGLRLVVVSNVDNASFARTLPKLGVELDAVVTAEDVRSYKPARAHFDRALALLQELGVAQSQILHVAQSLYHDHVPAQALGLATAWIDRRGDSAGDAPTARGATPAPPRGVRPTFTAPDMATFATMIESAAAP